MPTATCPAAAPLEQYGELVRVSGLPAAQLRAALLVLLQHNYVSCYLKEEPPTLRGPGPSYHLYEAALPRILQSLRWVGCVACVHCRQATSCPGRQRDSWAGWHCTNSRVKMRTFILLLTGRSRCLHPTGLAMPMWSQPYCAGCLSWLTMLPACHAPGRSVPRFLTHIADELGHESVRLIHNLLEHGRLRWGRPHVRMGELGRDGVRMCLPG